MQPCVLLRLFIPLGHAAPSAQGPGVASRAQHAHCRPHSQGLDCYLSTDYPPHSQPAACSPNEHAAAVTWLLADGCDAGVPAPPAPPDRNLSSLHFPGSERVTLLGCAQVHWCGLSTPVPRAALIGTQPNQSPQRPKHLQVFLYDPRQWIAVAAAEAGLPPRAARSCGNGGGGGGGCTWTGSGRHVRHVRHMVRCAWALRRLHSSRRGDEAAPLRSQPTLPPPPPSPPPPPPPLLVGRSALNAALLLLALALQMLVGPLAAAALWRQREALLGAAEAAAAGAERLLREQYDWLLTATPAGVKLHAEMCALLGCGAHAVLAALGAAARAGWPAARAPLAALLAAACAAGGLGGGLAVMHDMLAAAAAPLALQAAATGLLLRRHLAALAWAWGLLRGRGAAAASRRGVEQPAGGLGTPGPSATTHGSADTAEQRREPSGPPRVEDFTAGGKDGATTGASPRGGGGSGGAGGGSSLGGGGGLARPVARSGRLASRLPLHMLESLLGLAPDPGTLHEVVVERLIVGVLLLAPLTALLPTTLAWHTLALAAAAAPAAGGALLGAVAGLLRDSPLVALAWRAVRPLDWLGGWVVAASDARARELEFQLQLQDARAANRALAWQLRERDQELAALWAQLRRALAAEDEREREEGGCKEQDWGPPPAGLLSQLQRAREKLCARELAPPEHQKRQAGVAVAAVAPAPPGTPPPPSVHALCEVQLQAGAGEGPAELWEVHEEAEAGGETLPLFGSIEVPELVQDSAPAGHQPCVAPPPALPLPCPAALAAADAATRPGVADAGAEVVVAARARADRAHAALLFSSRQAAALAAQLAALRAHASDLRQELVDWRAACLDNHRQLAALRRAAAAAATAGAAAAGSVTGPAAQGGERPLQQRQQQ
ncbi:hypothetical protein GPECTOR_38g333 [Gonium pectorale]|uniref:Uncharacterized protein n=1 Tax=Gonium pectorale TaxID=33097 RepID=A0A150GB78_GONPE|nr:hypothetical protein GPECTOR_38g333 [Gonium pectorale]|eukprot:KXZ47096.1 hypothetical protein GPECTOR_38g333 [Gonium pectorale]